jgi:hypothetical protein
MGGFMRGILAVIWALIVFAVVVIAVGFCAMIGFPPHSLSGNILRIAGIVIALGLAINAYKKSAKPPSSPPPIS